MAGPIPHPVSHFPFSLFPFSFFLLLILGGLLAACGSSPEPPTPSPIPTTVAHRIPEAIETISSIDDTGAEVATVAPEVALTETYTNTTAGYAFDYPAGWLVDGEGEYVSLQNYRSEDLPPREVNDPDLYKIEFVWIRPGQARTVDEMLDQMRDGLEGPPKDVAVNGLEGIRITVRGFRGDTARILLLDLNGRVLLIQSWQIGRIFNHVIETVRPIEGNR